MLCARCPAPLEPRTTSTHGPMEHAKVQEALAAWVVGCGAARSNGDPFEHVWLSFGRREGQPPCGSLGNQLRRSVTFRARPCCKPFPGSSPRTSVFWPVGWGRHHSGPIREKAEVRHLLLFDDEPARSRGIREIHASCRTKLQLYKIATCRAHTSLSLDNRPATRRHI